MALASAVTAATIDELEAKLEGRTATPVVRVVDTDSVARLEFSMAAAGKTVPVALSVMKDAKRVRIQLMSHELDRPDADALQEHIAALLELRIVDRSTPESEARVRGAMEHSHDHKDLRPGALASAPAPKRRGLFRRR
jgi:hypothetical protein